MELFLDHTWESNLAELFVHYADLSQWVNVVKLSQNAKLLVQKGTLNIQTPSLVTVDGDYLTNVVSICVYLAKFAGIHQILFGKDYNSEAQNLSYVESCKNGKDFVGVFNKELELKTYFIGSHVTFADLAVFAASYQQLTTMHDEQKWTYCNFFRWFNNVQNLPRISEFLKSRKMAVSTFPQRQIAQIVKTNEKKKEKKQGTQAPPKDQEKAEQKKKQQQENAAKNKEKKEQQKQQQKNKKAEPAEELKDPADPLYFEQNLDIRVGEILKVWKHPESDKLWCEEINVGEAQPRQIASGLQEIIPIEGMTGKVCVMTNLKPRPLRKFPSNGMVMCATSADGKTTQILRPPTDAKIGDRILLEGIEDQFRVTKDPLPIQNDKKKILEKAFPHFKSDGDACATYADLKFKVAGGYCKTEIKGGKVA